MELGDLVISICLGASLAACAGLRAFLPLFILGLTSRLGFLGDFTLSQNFAWLSTTPALVCLGSATLLEIGADKIPFLDNALHVIYTIVRPGAGALSVLAVLNPDNPMLAFCTAVILGSGISLPVHLFSSTVRAGASIATAGTTNAFVSAKEDAIAFIGSLLAILIPVFAFIILMLGFYCLCRVAVKTGKLIFFRRIQNEESRTNNL